MHVTQGTVANTDLGQLVRPVIEGLADAEVLVVASTGGGDLALDRLPDNARVADFLPYDELLPRCDVMVTNGGYGSVNHALRYAVPLVAVGATEDKRDVAARVTWSGVGLGTTRRSIDAARARRAVERVLRNPAYRQRARELADQIAAGPSRDEVIDLIAGD
ncbi:glycosyltransferase [Serinicoccus sp. CUA-874]|uniref:glycosyltransferase n=1 Tax=Serinicoccus sp. CUA-874 TaxID=1517939 RepID=UPI000AED9314|nr:nucleotide disphospho-sugar-binding domain-containing protein [Serinicoccus sp. CUA-874]